MTPRHNVDHVVAKLKASHGYTSDAAAKAAIKAVMSAVWTVTKDGPVVITGIGTFEYKQRGERMGRNPHTGEPVTIPATRKPVFKASTNLIEAMSEAGDVPAERKPATIN